MRLRPAAAAGRGEEREGGIEPEEDDGDNEHLEHGDDALLEASMSIRSTAVTSSRTRVIRSPVARLSNQRSGNCCMCE